ncbi:MAG: hypothetical protein ACD_75C02369G0002 [uncultured bacterium]|nr:MAG: hypothetical protein ACD_75C02369G0002 [uncultured bacterium]
MSGFKKGVEMILGKEIFLVCYFLLGENGKAVLMDEKVRDAFLKFLFRSFKHGLQPWQGPHR